MFDIVVVFLFEVDIVEVGVFDWFDLVVEVEVVVGLCEG